MPTIDQFRPAVLKVLADGKEQALRDICSLVADEMNLSEELRAQQIASGQHRHVNRINWACSTMTAAELLERPRRGHYCITDNGRSVAQRSLSEYSERDMLEWPVWRSYQDEIAKRKEADHVNKNSDEDANSSNPLELLSAGEHEFNAQTETNLRTRLQEASPEFSKRP